MALLLSVLEQGMIYGILALGVYITYKILDFPDLTVDGSFPFGAAITVRLINGFGVPAILTLPIAFLGGALVGICTGLIHVKLKVRDLLSGIIMMTGLYTINLWVAGSGYVAIFDKENIFNNSFVNSSLFILIRPVNQDVKVISSFGRNSNKLLIASKIIHQCRIPLRCKCRCRFCFFHNHIAVIGRILCRCRRSLF